MVDYIYLEFSVVSLVLIVLLTLIADYGGAVYICLY